MSWTFNGFRGYAHARVITDFKYMADYHEGRTLKASEKAKNEDKNDCHKTTKDSLEEINSGERPRSAEKRLWIETHNKFVDILFALIKLLRIYIKGRRSRIQCAHCLFHSKLMFCKCNCKTVFLLF